MKYLKKFENEEKKYALIAEYNDHKTINVCTYASELLTSFTFKDIKDVDFGDILYLTLDEIAQCVQYLKHLLGGLYDNYVFSTINEEEINMMINIKKYNL